MIIALGNQDELPEMKNILFVIYFYSFQKNLPTSCSRAWWSHGSQDPLSYPVSPVSETHWEGSTDLEKGVQSKCPQDPGGKEISKGDGED